MKTYIKYLIALFTVTLCLGFAACGSDDDEPDSGSLKEKLQGTWVFSTGTVEVMGQKVSFDRSQLKDMAQDMGVSGFYDEVLTFNGDRVNGTRYSLDGNKLHFDEWSEYDDVWPTVKVSGSKLVLVYDMSVEGVKTKMTINYKKESSRSAIHATDDSAAGLLKLM